MSISLQWTSLSQSEMKTEVLDIGCLSLRGALYYNLKDPLCSSSWIRANVKYDETRAGMDIIIALLWHLELCKCKARNKWFVLSLSTWREIFSRRKKEDRCIIVFASVHWICAVIHDRVILCRSTALRGSRYKRGNCISTPNRVALWLC